MARAHKGPDPSNRRPRAGGEAARAVRRVASGNGRGHGVFIAHTSTDAWIARQIAKEVRQAGGVPRLDEEILRGGGSIRGMLADAIRECVEFIVLFTPWALQNTNVAAEVGLAHAHCERIVPVTHRVDAEEVKRSNYLLEDVKFIEINDLDGYFEDLRKRVGAP